MTSIGGWAFSYCRSLTNVYYLGSKSSWKKTKIGYNNDYLEAAEIIYVVRIYKFESNGGSAVSDIYNKILECPSTVYEGKTFLGWYDNTELSGDPITFPYSGDKTTLYAKWADNPTITYVGDYTGSITISYNANVTLPDPPTGYTYQFTVNGNEWTGENITEDVTVTVTKIINKYTVTFTGAYTESVTAEYGSNVTLPDPPTGYTYLFTVNGNTWTGENITEDVTVTVTKIVDSVEILGINLDNLSVDDGTLSGSCPYRVWLPEISLFDGAVYTIHQQGVSAPLTDGGVVLRENNNTFDLKVTAPSGRTRTYTLMIAVTVPKALGKFTASQITGGNVTVKMSQAIPGAPVLRLEYGDNRDFFENSVDARLADDGITVFAAGLPANSELYCRILADYEGIYSYSEPVLIKTTKSSDCYVIATVCPLGGKIIHNGENELGEISELRVANSFSSITIDVEVSPGATWELYATPTASNHLTSKTVKLSDGKSRTYYIGVLAEDGINQKRYKITIYRQSKSAKPTISADDNGLITITAAEGSKIIYTTDKTDPSEENGESYAKPFTVEGGTVIKAIAKNPDKDEYSDIVFYQVAGSPFTFTPLEADNTGKVYSYRFYIESSHSFCGSFIVAGYNKDGGLTEIAKTELDENSTGYDVFGEITINPATAYYKYFLWGGEDNLTPLCEAEEIDFDSI